MSAATQASAPSPVPFYNHFDICTLRIVLFANDWILNGINHFQT